MKKIQNPILNKIFNDFHNITRNVVYYSSDSTPLDHKKRIFTPELKSNLGIPDEINNMYEYTHYLGSDYSRLKMLTIISACSDIEYLLKQFIENYLDTNANKPKNFYQKLDDVNNHFFLPKGIDLNDKSFFRIIKFAFQVRHICIHNMGYVDESFNKNTGLDLPIDSKFEIDNNLIMELFSAIEDLIKFLDTL